MTYTSEDAAFRARLLSDLGMTEDPRWSITELLKRHRTQVLTKEGLGIPTLDTRLDLLESTYIVVPEDTFQSIRDTLTSAVSLGIHTVVAPGTYIHDNGAVLTVPTGVKLFFTPESSITVPVAVVKGVFKLSTDSTVEGATIAGNGSTKTSEQITFTADPGTSQINIINATVDDWCGYVVWLIDCSDIKIQGGKYTNVTRTTDGGSGVRVQALNADVDKVLIENLHVDNAEGTAIQVDGIWNNGAWLTTGFKSRNVTVTNCHTDTGGFAGIFLNSVFNGTITGCTSRNHTDYGIGVEFCKNVAISGCATESNATFGFTVFQSGQGISFSGCSTRNNTQHGFSIHKGAVTADSVTNNIAISGCSSTNNTQDGFHLAESTHVTLSGCVSLSNGSDGYYLSAQDFTLSSCIAKSNTAHGINMAFADRGLISNCESDSNTSSGIYFGGASGGNQITDILISGTFIRLNGADGIPGLNADCLRVSIIDCVFDTNTGYGITGSRMDYGLIKSCRFKGNTTGDINLVQPFDLSIDSNIFHTSAGITSVSLPGNGGFSGRRVIINSNVFFGVNSTDIGINASVGDNSSAGDDFHFLNNIMRNVATPYSWVNIGSMSQIIFQGEVTGTPEGVYRGGIGSRAYRTDGGASTTLYIKESGVNTNTGWVAK